jgi:hypothetical protein
MMQSHQTNTETWHIVVLTCRDRSTDFRLPLAQELHARGHRVHYVHVKRQPSVTDMSDPGSARDFSPAAFLSYATMAFRKPSPLAFFNSTNLRFPLFSRSLRLLCGGLWCFDMHDDLLYARSGIGRRRDKLAQSILLGGSDLVVHAAPALQRLFPASHHLGNASSIPRLERQNADAARVLILSSIDRRLDFDFLAATARAAPGFTFDIHGHIASGDASVASRLEATIAASANIRYRGPYANENLPTILGSYPVMFAPYAPSSQTGFIDPLRYYHGINSGMEVISTPIPGALDLRNILHLVDDPAAAAGLIGGLASGDISPLNANPQIRLPDWRDKATDLIGILSVHRSSSAA